MQRFPWILPFTDMNIKVEIVEKVLTETTFELIVECNGYENEVRVIQFSRSPFIYSNELTDEEIIQDISETEYKKYL